MYVQCCWLLAGVHYTTLKFWIVLLNLVILDIVHEISNDVAHVLAGGEEGEGEGEGGPIGYCNWNHGNFFL